MSYIDYAWARATRSSGFDDTPIGKQVAAITKGDPPFYARYDAPAALLDTDPEGLRAKVLAS